MRFVVASRPPVAAACVRAFLEAALPRDTLDHVRAGGSRCGFGQQPQIFGYDVFGFDPWMNQLKRTCRRVQRWTWMIHGDAAL
jgi:hypothetical protein